jgi:hypothetical protein
MEMSVNLTKRVPELLENIIILFHKACFLVLYISNKQETKTNVRLFRDK